MLTVTRAAAEMLYPFTRRAHATLGHRVNKMRGQPVNYLDMIAAEIQRTADPAAVPPDEDLPLYRLYAVLLLAKGKHVTLEDVHNAWAAWASEHDSDSRRILPFKELSLSVQRKDQIFVDAIHKVAARLGIERDSSVTD